MNFKQLTKSLGQDHERVIESMEKLAHLCWRIGRYDNALLYANAVAEKKVVTLPETETPWYCRFMSALSLYTAEIGSHKAACNLAEVAVERQKQHELLGPDHPLTLDGMLILSRIRLHLSQHHTVLDLAETVIKTCRRIRLGPLPADLSQVYKRIEFHGVSMKARCLWALGRHEEAVQYGQEAVSLNKALPLQEISDKYMAQSNLMLYLTFNENHEAASQQEESIMTECIQSLGLHPVAIDCMANLALRYSHLGRSDEALSLEEEIFKLHEGLLGTTHPDTLMAKSYTAMYLAGTGRYQKALSMEEQVLQAFQETQGDGHPHTAAANHNVAEYHYKLGRYSEALRYGQRALSLREKLIGKDHPYTKLTRKQVKKYQAKVSILIPSLRDQHLMIINRLPGLNVIQIRQMKSLN
jgi:tetratricopeptide (TPR) repeat protein